MRALYKSVRFMACRLNEFLPVAGVIQAEDDEKKGGDNHVEPIIEHRVEVNLRVNIQGHVEGVEVDVPGGILEGAVHEAQHEGDDDNHHGGTVAVLDGRAEEERKGADEKSRHQHLKGETHGRHGNYQPVGNHRQHEGDDKANDVSDEQAQEPHLVAVIRDTEDNLHDFSILIILEAKAHGIEHQEDARENEHGIGRSGRDFIVAEELRHHRYDEEAQGRQHEIEKLVAEDNLDIILHQFFYRNPKLYHNPLH